MASKLTLNLSGKYKRPTTGSWIDLEVCWFNCPSKFSSFWCPCWSVGTPFQRLDGTWRPWTLAFDTISLFTGVTGRWFNWHKWVYHSGCTAYDTGPLAGSWNDRALVTYHQTNAGSSFEAHDIWTSYMFVFENGQDVTRPVPFPSSPSKQKTHTLHTLAQAFFICTSLWQWCLGVLLWKLVCESKHHQVWIFQYSLILIVYFVTYI